MATGDILTATIVDKTTSGIGTDGWYVDVVIEGFVGGGTYDFGMGTNNDPAFAKFVMTVTSEGYNSSGTLGTVVRTLYGTKVLRQAYPNQALLQETESGGNLTIRVALSDYVYDDDKNGGAGTSGTDPTLAIASGWYTDDGTGGTTNANNAVTGLSVTNNSTTDYPPIKVRFRTPSGISLSGSFRPAVEVRHAYGQGKGAPAVKFTLEDSSANTVTEIVTTPEVLTSTLDSTLPKIEVYSPTLDTSLLNANEVATLRVEAYPFVGDTPFDSNSYTFPNKLATQPHHIGGTKTYVYVATDGDNGTGVASTTAATASASPFADMWSARNALATAIGSSLNNGVIRFKAGNHVWGRSGFAGTVNADSAFLLCETDPDAGATAVFTAKNTTAGNLLCDRVRLSNIDVIPTGSIANFFQSVSSDDYYQFENVKFVHSGTGTNMVDTGVEYSRAYNCRFTNFIADPQIKDYILTDFVNHEARLGINDNDYSGIRFDQSSNWNGGAVFSQSASASFFISSLEVSSAAKPVIIQGYPITQGYVGNSICVRTTSSTESQFEFSDQAIDDLFVENCTIPGSRFNPQNTSTTNRLQTRIFMKSCIASYIAPKGDVFGTNGTLTGGWAYLYGVGWRNNFNGDADTFPFEFDGLNTIAVIGGGPLGSNPAFIDDNSIYGDDDSSTFGDYTPAPGSVVIGAMASGTATSTYDLYGNPINGDIGAVQTVAAGSPITYTYQWWRADDAAGTNAVQIAGATASSYQLQPGDANKYIRVEEIATRDGASASAFSQWEGPVIGAGPTFKPYWALNRSLILGSGIR